MPHWDNALMLAGTRATAAPRALSGRGRCHAGPRCVTLGFVGGLMINGPLTVQTLAHFHLRCCCLAFSFLGFALCKTAEGVERVNKMAKPRSEGQAEKDCESGAFIRKFTQ